MAKLFSSNSFKVRAKVSTGIVLIVIIGTLTPNAWGLRITYSIAALLSFLEVYSLAIFQRSASRSLSTSLHSLVSLSVLSFSIAAAIIMPSAMLPIGIILTMASDVGAYAFGKICGGKFIHSRPFPTVSPNKSWEGIVGGLLTPGLAILPLNYLFRNSLPGQPLPTTLGCLVGLCAIIGDTSESALKRRYKVKDANDVLKNQSGFRHIEAWLGGSEGHGGYYDRLDSMSVVLLLIGIVTVICTSSPWSRR